MSVVHSEYQGIKLLSSEFTLTTGTGPGRGTARALRSEIGDKLGSLPDVADLIQEESNGEMMSTVDLPPKQKPKPPAPTNGLTKPLGAITFTSGDPHATEIILAGILWTGFFTEDVDSKDDEKAVIRIELADDRALWGLGGTVFGELNRTLKEEDAYNSRALKWAPTPAHLLGGLSVLNDYTIFLDPNTCFKRFRPWNLQEAMEMCLRRLARPPVNWKISDKAKKIIPLNIRWGRGTLAVSALEDLLRRYSYVLCRRRSGNVRILPMGEEEQDDNQLFTDALASSLVSDKSPRESREIPYEPVSVEVIGDRILHSVLGVNWEMVIKDSEGLVGSTGQWVPLRLWLKAIKYPFVEMSQDLMMTIDSESKAFHRCPPRTHKGDKGSDDKDLHFRRVNDLRQHAFRSFRAVGASRYFLPFLTQRPEQRHRHVAASKKAFTSETLNLLLNGASSESLKIESPTTGPSTVGADAFGFYAGRDWLVVADFFYPNEDRSPHEALWLNAGLVSMEWGDLDHVDEKEGIVTFKRPIGYVDSVSNFDPSNLVPKSTNLFKSPKQWDDMAVWFNSVFRSELSASHALKVIFKNLSSYTDSFASLRRVWQSFLDREFQGNFLSTSNILYDKKTFRMVSNQPTKKELDELTKLEFKPKKSQVFTKSEMLNLSEFIIHPPRIMAIWGWPQDFGSEGDFYRLRAGIDPEKAAYPIVDDSLHQYITINGLTNRDSLDIVAKSKADDFLEDKNVVRDGSDGEFGFFHDLEPTGLLSSISWSMDLQGASGTTRYSRGQRTKGILNRLAPVPAFVSHFRPPPEHRAEVDR